MYTLYTIDGDSIRNTRLSQSKRQASSPISHPGSSLHSHPDSSLHSHDVWLPELWSHEWGRSYDRRFTKALGFTHRKTPCVGTLHNVLRNILRNIDIKLLEFKLGIWSESIMSHGQEQEAVVMKLL